MRNEKTKTNILFSIIALALILYGYLLGYIVYNDPSEKNLKED